MRKATLLMVLAIVLFLTNGCVGKSHMGTMIGTAVGGLAGGFIPQAFGSDVSPIVQTIAPIAGAAAGAGLGYLIDSNMSGSDEQAAALQNQQAQQMQQAQIQQQQMQRLQQTARLSVPATVVTGNNQGVPVRNGSELTNVLIQFQPGTQFGMLVSRANAQALIQDMAGNGYISVGAARPYGQNVVLTFQKPNARTAAPTPMPLAQAARMM